MTDQPAAKQYDLRYTDVRDVLDRVERMLDVHLDPSSMVRKRRTIGAATDLDTWVRIELRGTERMGGPITGQGWGIEAAQAIIGVARPQWFRGASWRGDPSRPGTMWRVDEIEHISGGERLRTSYGQLAPAERLPEAWWRALGDSINALTATETSRIATPDCQPVTTARVEAEIRQVFPEVGDLRTDSWEWTTAHADLGWANLVGPRLWITDWEDWGQAPRGLDAANLWANSLSHPTLAAKVASQLETELISATGRIMALWRATQIVTWGNTFASAYDMARIEAARVASEIA